MKVIFLLLFLFPVISSARDFQTERPTRIRTAYTLNDDEVAIESELINYREDEETNSFESTLAKSLIRYGMTSYSELQVDFTPYTKVDSVEGFGDTRLNFKSNILGNDGGKLSIAYGVFADFPTAGANLNQEKMEGGLFVTTFYKLNSYWATGLMTEVNNVPKRANWQTNLSLTYSIFYTLFSNSTLVLELFNESGLNEDESNNATFDIAIQYSFSNNLKIDIGFFKGLSPDAEDEELFAGTSYLL